MFPVSAIRSSNVVVFYSSILFFLALSHVGISGDTVISSGYGSNDSNKSALFEYAIIFFVISQIYTSSSFVQKTVTLICLIYFCLKSVLYGGRIEALQAGLAFLYMAYDFGRDIDKKKLISMGLLALVLMTFVGVIRSNPELISRALRGDFSMEMLFSVPKTGIVSSQFGDVMQASSRMVGLADSGFWTSELRIMSFLSFIFNIFLYGSSFQETSNLALLDQTSFGAGGGGLISAYFYVWLGWLGPFFAGIWLVVSLYLGLYRNKVNMFLAIYAISLIITFPRWLAYSPVVFVKYGVFAILCMLAFYIYNRVIREFLST
ncbi:MULTISPECIES: hypothetical protein [unclassified Vibrio]|uniref:hypothetical protein n=1 Tax=unclassified Vibrio TaxID=2614977 RepID=UPI0035541E9B